MENVWLWGMLGTTGMLALVAVVPPSWGRRRPGTFASGVCALAAVHLCCQIIALGGIGWTGGASELTLVEFAGERISLHLDMLSSVVGLVVATVGLAVCRYSVRYLAGDQRQVDFYRWTALTLAAVTMMVLSGNFALLLVSWMLAGLALHFNLTYHADRARSKSGAWGKFVVSRVGDVMLVIAAVLAYRMFGTLEIAAWGSLVVETELLAVSPQMAFALGMTLTVGMLAKTAQFPFHGWLPETLDVPTPVSALMHAGVVNAGGYVFVRCGMLLDQIPAAMLTAIVVGALTASMGVIVMQRQNSVKRCLAWSTVAQMGLMILQCGLGAYSAAIAHLIAHSVYKAYAFLASGSLPLAMAEASQPTVGGRELLRASGVIAQLRGIVAGLAILVLFVSLSTLVGAAPWTKPGGLVLTAIFCGALAWLWMRGRWLSPLRGVAVVSAMMATYLALYLGVDWLVVSTGAVRMRMVWGPASQMLMVIIALSLMLFGRWIASNSVRWSEWWYVQTLNGFYLDLPPRWLGRATTRLSE